MSPAAEQCVQELLRIKAEMDSRAAALAVRFGVMWRAYRPDWRRLACIGWQCL